VQLTIVFRLPCGTAGNAQRLIDQGGGVFRTSGHSAPRLEGSCLSAPEISIDDLAAARKSTGLGHLGRRFHRIYDVT
jgi:hypothetical protein